MKLMTKNMTILSLGICAVFALTACNDSNDDQSQNTPSTQPQDQRDQRFLNAKAGDILQVQIADLIPTQGAVGYDQIYYKLGRWQGDWNRQTWQADPINQLSYLNKTIGKKFSDYCEAIGAKSRDDFSSMEQLKGANLKQLDSFGCAEQPATETADLKTVVVGYDGRLYLTDGHHTMTQLRELPDGGETLKVWVRVVDNYSSLKTADEFWTKMVANGRAWLRNGQNQSITYQQLPKNLGLKSATNPTGMEENQYRSLMYFVRDIGYSKPENATDFLEFLWQDWLEAQVKTGMVQPLSFYHLDAKIYGGADVLASTSIKKDLTLSGSATGYTAAIANYALLIGTTAPDTVIYQNQTAKSLGSLNLQKNADKGSVTANAISTFDELNRDEVKKDGTPRSGGSVWYAVHYRECGKPITGTCWGW
ncbi:MULTISPECIES: ParB/Srx family N-terminal domain-containing protein [Acinetobacter]|uniref:ParB-like nuclease n=2 Tax=Acinetobacter TaxID=469 RepID=N9DIT9_9GAMM|nr:MULTISPECIES: ParB/Srx family N-terminal domain-containing protein [Acinetobacter]ENV80720.1 hypothetical protein F942_00542 [Acinetobacter ursingii ANC 3649]MDH2105316.1 ParB/Srx family N-terminal domain-containing protein [Acinetobacter ursingii]MEC6124952.1 ParB/Srx family N-terminal domain-containing protein [Acinetobacter ursingii]PZT85618.1 MAG: chromosome partitioning protein ParB [Acinetobacter sp.]QXZ22016.1 ParB/Srx family N-terminal domain-containing protein [Acinetobacter septic